MKLGELYSVAPQTIRLPSSKVKLSKSIQSSHHFFVEKHTRNISRKF